MSGGHFNYKDGDLKSEIFDYGDKPSNQFDDMEISQLVWDVLTLIHEYDWYVSGDTGKETYMEAKKAFKAKWLSGDRNANLEAIIDARLLEVRSELKEML
jgi:hypothetical protein